MMNQRWEKLGLVLDPADQKNQRPWAVTHAAVPIAVHLNGDRYRVFVTTRDGDGRAHIGHFELGLARNKPMAGRLCDSPVLAPGSLGSFDDRGAMTSWVVARDARQYH